MSTVIGRGSIPRLTLDGINKVFGDELTEHPTKYDKMFAMNTSTKAYELDAQLEGFGLAGVKDEGDDIEFDSRRQGFLPKYPHIAYSKGYIVTREALADEQYNQLTDGAKALGRAMRITKEIIGADVYNNGFDPAFTMPDGDGSALFAVDHSNGPSGGTYTNKLAIDANLTEATLEDASAIVQNMADARGLPMALQSLRLIVAAGTSTFNAQRILGSVLQNDTDNNATNAMKDLNTVRDNFMSSPYLTNNNAWFLTTDAPNGLKCFDREGVEFDQDNAFTSYNARFKAYERYSFGWTDPRGAVGSAGA